MYFHTSYLSNTNHWFVNRSYRPISLTSVCCKILEHIVYSQTMAHLEKHKILTNLQPGYRSKCSTETQLLKAIDFLAKGLENSSKIDVISLDFARAFDVVPFQKLLVKMNHYGIRKLLPWFFSFYLLPMTNKYTYYGMVRLVLLVGINSTS